MAEPQVIHTESSIIWLDNEGIIHKVFLENALERLSEALESIEIIRNFCREKKRPLLVDFSKAKSVDPDARALYASDEIAHIISAVAGVTHSKISQVIGNFFIGFNRPTTPNRLFTTEQDAIAWLKDYR